VGLFTAVAYGPVKAGIEDLARTRTLDRAIAEVSTVVWEMLVRAAALALVIGIADYVFNRWKNTKGLKMSKEELKQEYKSSDGNPLVKGQRRRRAMEISRNRLINVASAHVVVTKFPSLLLIATLFRLALNVSSTRLILLDGYAGKVIESFGNFVIGGSVVVGLVGVPDPRDHPVRGDHQRRRPRRRGGGPLHPRRHARQADGDRRRPRRRAHHRGRPRRAASQIAKEADFYGAMDGASKFVKGDAIAGIIITAINLIGGFAIGTAAMGMEFGEAVEHLLAAHRRRRPGLQIPALLISIATGLIVTRADELGVVIPLSGSATTHRCRHPPTPSSCAAPRWAGAGTP
jgi:hypothetical protein